MTSFIFIVNFDIKSCIMYKEWKDFFEPAQENISNNINSKKSSVLILFVIVGFIISLGLINKIEDRSIGYFLFNPSFSKIQKLKANIESIEMKNTVLESEILILNHFLTQMLEDKKKTGNFKIIKINRNS
ncbi:MAG: hypothetical protein V2B14_01400 [bacterium]